MNLIGNAIKFTEEGEVDVSASVTQRDGDEAAVEFRVRDTGSASRRSSSAPSSRSSRKPTRR